MELSPARENDWLLSQLYMITKTNFYEKDPSLSWVDSNSRVFYFM